jgi:thioredoxin-dependent peroxiredoxin
MPISAENPAPEFEMLDDTNVKRKLSDYRGRKVILYFYPADDTPGCTKEACNFRDDYSAYEKANVVILGVSPDDVESHVKFKRKFQIPFPLLVDEGHQVCDAYGQSL